MSYLGWTIFPTGSSACMLGSHLVALFWETVGPLGGGSIAVGSGSLGVPALRLTAYSGSIFLIPKCHSLAASPFHHNLELSPSALLSALQWAVLKLQAKTNIFSLRLVLINIQSQDKQSDQHSIISERSESFMQCYPLLRNFVFEGASLLTFPPFMNVLNSVYSPLQYPKGISMFSELAYHTWGCC